MSRPGDWNCRSCYHLNFQRRDSCQRCGEPRLGSDYGVAAFGGSRMMSPAAPFAFYNTGPDVRPGDWYCAVGNCGAHNFASRSTCFKCGAMKEELSGGRFFDGADMAPRMRGFGFGVVGSGSSSGGVSGGGGRSSWKLGDWICTRLGCNEHNFASRTECFSCNAPRESSSGSGRSSHSS